jgi:hypothetical protein
MIPKTSIVPPGGHHFIERHNGAEHKITGSSFIDVAEQLLRFRVANKIDVGQPLDEVNAYVCETWPHFCHAASPQVMPKTSEPSFTVAVMAWMKQLWERQAHVPRPLESETVANRRAEICHGCPLQRDWADYGCGSCVSSIRQQSFVFRAGKEPHRKVTGCSILKQENNAACFANVSSLPDMTPEQRAALPNHCWRKNP